MHQKQVKYAFGCRLTFDSDVVARDGIDIKRLARFQQPGHAVTGNSWITFSASNSRNL